MRIDSVVVVKKSFLTTVAALAIYGFSTYEARLIRPPIHPRPELSREPLQIATDVKPFVSRRNGIRYLIEPRFTYDIYGLVVSYHDSNAWWDMAHAAWNDYISTRDICVVWGENLKNELYRRLDFSSGEWTCYAHASDAESWRSFHMEQLSNNHVLPASDEVAQTLAKATYGDQIRMTGYLVNYERAGFPPGRTTSVTRTDTGNGACEIIWVEKAEILHRQPGLWRYMRFTSGLLISCGLLGIILGFASALVVNKET